MSEEPRQRLVGEIFFVLLMVALSAFLLWASYMISGFQSLSSAGSFPMAVSAVMVVSGLIVLVQTVRMKPQKGETSVWNRFVSQVTPPVIVATAVLIFAYMAVLEWLGFLAASYVFLVLAMALLGSRRWGLNLIVSAFALGVIYLVFQTAFAVVLPSGSVWQGVFQ